MNLCHPQNQKDRDPHWVRSGEDGGLIILILKQLRVSLNENVRWIVVRMLRIELHNKRL